MVGFILIVQHQCMVTKYLELKGKSVCISMKWTQTKYIMKKNLQWTHRHVSEALPLVSDKAQHWFLNYAFYESLQFFITWHLTEVDSTKQTWWCENFNKDYPQLVTKRGRKCELNKNCTIIQIITATRKAGFPIKNNSSHETSLLEPSNTFQHEQSKCE